MQATSPVATRAEINAAVSEIVQSMSPDVVRIRFDLGPDWSGDPAIFFRILLSDDAAEKRAHETSKEVRRRLDERLDFISMGLFAYHNIRSVSEQAELKEASWE